MRLLVTGASGFLGSRIVVLGLQAGHEIVALVRASSSLDRLAEVRQQIRIARLPDDASSVPEAVRAAGRFDGVVHAAATYGKSEPMSQIVSTNVSLGLALLEACGPTASAFVNVGTALPPSVSSYAATKRQFSRWAAEEAARESWPFADLAVELMYGPGDPADRLVASLILCCLREADHVPLTQGNQIRDFVFVDDVAQAALGACLVGIRDPNRRRLSASVGSGVGTSIRSVAEAVRHATGARTRLEFGAVPLRPNEVMRSVADDSAERLFGWRPTVTLEDGLRRTIEWYQSALTTGSVR